MTNYSRTTLRELKKRYLNILKKCLLANLMAFSFCLPVMAEETWDENGNGYSIVSGTEETPLDLTSSNYFGYSLSGSYNNLIAKLEYAKTNQVFMIYLTPDQPQTTVLNINIYANNIENSNTFRGVYPNDPKHKTGEELKLIEAKNVDFKLKNFGDESKLMSTILGTSIDHVLFKVQNNVSLNFENTYASSITGIKASNTADVIMPNVTLNSKNVISNSSITGIASGWIGSNFTTYEKPPYEKFDIKNITLNIEDTISKTGHIYAIDSNLWGNTVGNSNDLVFTVENIDINLKNSTVGHSLRAIGSGTGIISGNPTISVSVDENSFITSNLVGYYGYGFSSEDRYLANAELGDITFNVAGFVNSMEGIYAYNTKSVSTGDITVNLNGATIGTNITGFYLAGNNQHVSIGDFKVNVYGNTVVNGSIMASNDKGNEVLTMGESILTVEENAHLTVGSIDMDTNIIKGDISFIDQINLKKKGALKGAVNSQNLAETSVALEEESSLQLTGDSYIDTLSSDGGAVDLSNTTSETSIQVGSLEGEGTTFKVASEEVAQTTIGNNKSKKLTVSATGEFNDQVNDANKLATSLASVLTIQEGETDLTLAAEEGKIARPMMAEVKDGLVQNVRVSGNGVTESVKDVMGLQVLSFRNQINDVQKRMGDLRLDENTKGTWVRAFGGDVKFGDMGLKNKYNTIQAGADFKKGNAYFGVMASLTKGDSKMNRGTGEDKTYGMGVYAGYMADNGWYVDATAKQMHLQNKFKAQYTTGEVSRGSYKTWGTSVSLEAGKRMQLPCGFFVEPQVELMYGRVQGIDYTTSAGVKVEQEAFESLIGRAGLSAGKTFKEKGSIYANVSILNDFAGKTKTSFTYQSQETKTKDDMGGAWTEFAVGGTYKLNKNTALYGEFATSKGTDLTNPIQWSVGLRLSF